MTNGKRLARAIYRNKAYYLMLLPAVVYVAIFAYAPMYGLQIAFKDFKGSLGITGSKWVGFKHFESFFSGYYFWRLMRNTFLISIYSLLFGFPIPIILALMLNEIKGGTKNVVQTVLYAPHFISTVVLIGILKTFFSPSIGIVNNVIEKLGGERVYFESLLGFFRSAYVGSGIWQNMGWDAVIYLAALSAVDVQLHEAAIIDGASKLQRVWYINVPTILPTVMIMLIMSVGNLASVGYEKVYLMQNDLNLEVSEVISTYVYKRGLLKAQYSFSTAVGIFNNLINVALLLIANFISGKLSGTSLF